MMTLDEMADAAKTAHATLRRKIDARPDYPESWDTLGDNLSAAVYFDDETRLLDTIRKINNL